MVTNDTKKTILAEPAAQSTTTLVDQLVAEMPAVAEGAQALLPVKVLLEYSAQQRLQGALGCGKAADTIGACLHDLQQKIGAQVAAVLRHPEVRRREAAWLGTERLVSRVKPGPRLGMSVQTFKRDELVEDMRDCRGDHRRSRLFEFLGRDGYFMPGGQPTSLVVFDVTINPSPGDIELLHFIAKVAADAHLHVLVGASPEFVGAKSFADMLRQPDDLAELWSSPKFASWRSFRQQPYAKYVGLAMPRWLARRPYGPEAHAPGGQGNYPDAGHVWVNAAFIVAERFGEALNDFGWPVAVIGPLGGGACPGLPTVVSQDDSAPVGPMEIALDNLTEAPLGRDGGLIAVVQTKHTDEAVVYSMPSAYQPPTSTDKEFESAAKLAAQLPNGMALSRFAHMLKVLMRQYIGMALTPAEVQQKLQDWIADYTISNPENAGARIRAERPLRDARVAVRKAENEPGVYEADVLLVPHFQLDQISLRLTIVEKVNEKR